MRQLSIAAVAAVLLAGPIRADEEKVPLDKVPKVVLDTAKKRFPKAEVVGASKEAEDGKTVYEIELKLNGKTIDVTLTPTGALTLIEKEIDAKGLPKAVAATLSEKYPKASYKIIEEVTAVKEGKEAVDFYEVLLVTGDKMELEVQVAPDGKVKGVEVKKEGKQAEKKPGESGDTSDETLPKKVAAAVKKTFPGATVVGVEKEDEDGEVTFEVELRYESGSLEVVLSEKGKVVKVKFKGGKGEKVGDGKANRGEKKTKNEKDERD